MTPTATQLSQESADGATLTRYALAAPVQGCAVVAVREADGCQEILGAADAGAPLARLLVLAPGCPGDPAGALRLWAGVAVADAAPVAPRTVRRGPAPPSPASPLLTIYTPTYRRPAGLARCKASVAEQTRADLVQHLVIEDAVGLGIDGMYRAMPEHHDAVRGQWVFVLSDDDVLPDADVVAEFARLVGGGLEADVVMARAQIGPFTYPSDHCWRAAPEQGHVTLSNWFVRREVFVAVPYGARYEGDYDFIAACWARGLRFAWWPRLVCVAAGWSRGAPEEGV